jgi:hypothetical protein
VLRALGEVGEVPIGQTTDVPPHVPLCQLDEVAPDDVADTPASRVQHDPEIVVLIQAQLDEMVAATERTELPDPGLIRLLQAAHDFRVTRHDALQPHSETLQ